MKGRGIISFVFAGCLLGQPVAGGEVPLEFDCATFGSGCEQELSEGDPHVSELVVPPGACDAIGGAAVRVDVDHSWVGDLRLVLEHEPSGVDTVLVERPGAPVPTTYGCPEQGIEATFDKDGALLAEVVCNDTIPAISGVVRAAPYASALTVAPDDPTTFVIAGCPFLRFEGRFVPPTPSSSSGCPSFFPSEEVNPLPCRFRGRWNDECGDDSLEVDLERLDDKRFIVRIRGQRLPYNFQGVVVDGLLGDLTSFGAFADREIDGALELSQIGLSRLEGESCAGTWRLRVDDEAPPNVGRLRGWSLLLAPEPTVTATSTPTPTATATATNTSTASATPTSSFTATVSRTPTSSATLTSTGSPTPTPTATSTGLVPGTPTPSPSSTPTPSSTRSSTFGASNTPTPTPTATDTPTSSSTATSTATASATATRDTPTATPTSSGTLPTATETATETLPTPTPEGVCTGDCDGSGVVSISELIRAVNIALGNSTLDLCSSADADGDGEIAINELILAVRHALDGC